MKAKRIIAIIAAVLITAGGVFFVQMHRLTVSEFSRAFDFELMYLVENVSPNMHIPDYNFDRGNIPAGTPKGQYNVYPTPKYEDFDAFCRKTVGTIGSWSKEVTERETQKLSETDAYIYCNTSVTYMREYYADGVVVEKKPVTDEYNFTLFLKNFVDDGLTVVYTGEMTADAIEENFDAYLYNSKLLAREVSETETEFIYDYVSYDHWSGFWSGGYGFFLKRITIQKESGEIKNELIQERKV